MLKRKLGRTDLSIAPSCSAATCSAGPPTRDVVRPARPLRRAGLDAIDTADVYSTWAPGNVGGELETIIGDWLQARAASAATMTIVTKVGSPMGAGRKGLSARYIEQAVEGR